MSAALTLYCSKTSPFARKVRVVIEELGLTERVQEVVADPFNPPAELLAANPLSRIPTLVTERGLGLPDSSLIIDYLLKLKPGGLPRPPAGSRRWAARRRQLLAEGVLEAAVASILEKRRPESIVYPAFLDRQAAVIGRALDALEAEHTRLDSSAPGLAEITTGVALAYLDFRLPYLEWRPTRPGLAAWYPGFAQRPSMVRTQPPV
ncbi:MAG TPA: glutathione S-transferase family protein [Nevskiaceae bacterium]|nr:glutathione S-transferase family protein [Nevskiaceae bacterium]